MSPAPTRAPDAQPKIAAIDESAEGKPTMTGGAALAEFIDEPSLTNEIAKAVKRNRSESRPFRQYQKKVIEEAGVRNTHLVRQLASNICGMVARLPDVPDDELEIELQDGTKSTEWKLQVTQCANEAQRLLDSQVVMIASARKLAEAAMEIRQQDPDGKKNIAWVNDQREDEAGVLDE